MNDVPHYVRIARALAFVSVVGASASCARIVVPEGVGDASDARGEVVVTDANSADAACPTTMPTFGTACTAGCTWGMEHSCDYCECAADPSGAHTWHCYACGGPCLPPDLDSSRTSAIG